MIRHLESKHGIISLKKIKEKEIISQKEFVLFSFVFYPTLSRISFVSLRNFSMFGNLLFIEMNIRLMSCPPSFGRL